MAKKRSKKNYGTTARVVGPVGGDISIFGHLDEIEPEARTALEKAGFESAWPELLSVEPEVHSVAWFARQILIFAHATREFVEKRDTENAAFAAMKVGYYQAVAGFKECWEKPALSGAKSLTGAKRGRENVTKIERDTYLAEVYLERRNSTSETISNTALKEKIGWELEKLKPITARKAIDRGLEALKKTR
jgi:hypothetical protein